MSNAINHPPHYASGKIEVIEAIEDWKLNFHRGNAVKYTARAGKKDPTKEIEDLEKAVWYLKREIEVLTSLVVGKIPTRPNDMNPRVRTMESLEYSSATDVSNLELPDNLVPTAENVLNHFLRGRKWESILGRWATEKGTMKFIPLFRSERDEELLHLEDTAFILVGV